VPGGIHHSVVVVRDLDASLRSYRDGISLDLLLDRQVEGDWLLDAARGRCWQQFRLTVRTARRTGPWSPDDDRREKITDRELNANRNRLRYGRRWPTPAAPY